MGGVDRIAIPKIRCYRPRPAIPRRGELGKVLGCVRSGRGPSTDLPRGARVHGLQLKFEDWVAAQKLFEQQTHLGDALDRDALLYYAREHAANGLRAFRLKSGELEPDGPVAAARRQYDRGEITSAEFDAVFEARLRRPPDEAAMNA